MGQARADTRPGRCKRVTNRCVGGTGWRVHRGRYRRDGELPGVPVTRAFGSREAACIELARDQIAVTGDDGSGTVDIDIPSGWVPAVAALQSCMPNLAGHGLSENWNILSLSSPAR